MEMSARNPRYCFQCDDGTVLVHEKKDVHGHINGESFTVPAVSGWHCPVCGEIEFDEGEGQRYSSALNATRQAVEMRRADELAGLTETAHLLRSAKNAERLLAALNRARTRDLQPADVAKLG